jgi:hypothetical protein
MAAHGSTTAEASVHCGASIPVELLTINAEKEINTRMHTITKNDNEYIKP